MGRFYKIGRVYKRGNIFWIQYYCRGQLFRESSRSRLKSLAVALLKKRLGEIVDGRLPALCAEKTTFEDLVAIYLQDYRLNDRRSLETAQAHITNLRKTLQGLRAFEITTQRINEHIALRRREGRATATINRELSALKRMFTLAFRSQPPLVGAVPYIPFLRGEKVRQGFFQEEEYCALVAALPDHLKVPVVIGYWTGMRKGEILSLRWEQVDLERGLIRLEPGTTKNQEGREAPLVPEALQILNCWRMKTLEDYPACPWVCHYRGRPLKEFRRAWAIACQRVGLEGKLFHDLRRSAVRNMVRAGIPEVVAMRISGHRTRSVFDRYAIVSSRDLELARTKLTALAEERALVRDLLKA